MLNQKQIAIWCGFFCLIVFTYIFCSSGDFSFILTLAAGVQCFGFGLVSITIYLSNDPTGVSWNTFFCCGLALTGRLMSILFYEGYLPVDASGDYVYRIFEMLSLIFCVLTLFKLKTTRVAAKQNSLESLKWYYFAPPMLILAYLVHPGLNYFSPLDILWTFGLYLESVALLPQIFLFQKREKEIEGHTSNFVVSQAISRVIQFIFWINSFNELNEGFNESTLSIAPWYSGYFVMGAQIIQILLMADFLWMYFMSWKNGTPFVMLPK